MKRLIPGIALLLCLPAHAAGPQVTDPAGDANGTGVAAQAPASMAAYDITAVRWYADESAQRIAVTFADTVGDGRFVLTWATPSCPTQSLQWYTTGGFSYLEGCKPRHQRWLKPPVVSGRTLTFSVPRRDLPSWLAAGTTVSKLGATAGPIVEFRTGVLHPEVDTAFADVKYVVGT